MPNVALNEVPLVIPASIDSEVEENLEGGVVHNIMESYLPIIGTSWMISKCQIRVIVGLNHFSLDVSKFLTIHWNEERVFPNVSHPRDEID